MQRLRHTQVSECVHPVIGAPKYSTLKIMNINHHIKQYFPICHDLLAYMLMISKLADDRKTYISCACQVQCPIYFFLDRYACGDAYEFIMCIFLLVKLSLVPILKLYHYPSFFIHWVKGWGAPQKAS